MFSDGMFHAALVFFSNRSKIIGVRLTTIRNIIELKNVRQA